MANVDYLPVEETHRGLALDEFLSVSYPRYTKGFLRGLIREGRVGVDGRAVVRPVRVRTNQVVSIEFPEDAPEPIQVTREGPEIRTLFEDEDVWVVDKPPRVAVEPERWDRHGVHLAGAVLDHLEVRFEGKVPFRPRVVHRLDKDTSGVLVFAKNLESEQHLRRQFESRKIAKEYLAIVDGEIDVEGVIDLPIGPDARRSGRMRIDEREGKPSLTRYRPEENFRGFTLVRVFPESGRTHQIRVHLRARGFPLVVDRLYGRRDALKLSEFKAEYRRGRSKMERPLLDRLALHAAALTFTKRDDAELRVESPLPKDLEVTCKQLRRWRTR